MEVVVLWASEFEPLKAFVLGALSRTVHVTGGFQDCSELAHLSLRGLELVLAAQASSFKLQRFRPADIGLVTHLRLGERLCKKSPQSIFRHDPQSKIPHPNPNMRLPKRARMDLFEGTLNPKPQTLNPQTPNPRTPNPKPETQEALKPQTLNPKPTFRGTLSPKPPAPPPSFGGALGSGDGAAARASASAFTGEGSATLLGMGM